MCVDIRLQSNPNLDVVFENPVECPPFYIEESVMENTHTNCSVSIDHEVPASPVTRVPMEPAPLVEEIFTEEDECVGITRICVKEAKITFATCPVERLFSETADKRARLSPEVQVTS